MKNSYRFFRKFIFSIFVIEGILPTVFAEESPDVGFLSIFKLGRSPLTTIDPANAIGKEINDLYALTAWIGLLIFMIIVVLFIVIVFKFREKTNPTPKDSHGNFFLEVLWTVIPIVILIIIAIPTIRLIFLIDSYPDFKKNEDFKIELTDQTKKYLRYLEVNVIAHQWWWEFEYLGMHERKPGQSGETFLPIYRVTANEPWFPVNVPIKINLTSEDVVHSFWLPKIIGKKDAIPGVMHFMTFVIEKPGYYFGECAEYCGASHSLMRFHVKGVSETDFDKWLKWGRGEPLAVNASAERGKTAIRSCMACHTMNGLNTFQLREERLKIAMEKYEVDRVAYLSNMEEWKKNQESKKRKWRIELFASPSKPVAPKIPKLFQENFVTVAPDLTDFRFRKKILAGIRENTRTNLTEWIQDPPSVKPEIKGTPTIRMPAYKHLFSDQTIQDIVEFLYTVEYSNSDEKVSLTH